MTNPLDFQLLGKFPARVFVAVVLASTATACSSPPRYQTPAAAGMTARPPADGSQGSDTTLVPAVAGLPTDPGSAGEQRLSPGDVLAVEVFQVEELSSRERVGDDGAIVMPLIGSVPIAGLTTDQAEARIAAALQKDYLQNPQVNIFVEEFANMKFTVGGAVNHPGVFELTGDTTLLQAIANAEGVTDLADPTQVILFRSNASDGIGAYVVNLNEIEKGELRDPLLASNDKIMVPKSGSAVFLKSLGDTLRGFVRAPVF